MSLYTFPTPIVDITESVSRFATPVHLHRFANKILLDMEKRARVYQGKAMRMLRPDGEERCTLCTNEITGAIVLHDCPVCIGTGKLNAYKELGEYLIFLDVVARELIPSEMGNIAGGKGDYFVLVGAPEVKYDDLFIMSGSNDVYRAQEQEPAYVAMQGHVVAQIITPKRLSPGAIEYRLV